MADWTVNLWSDGGGITLLFYAMRTDRETSQGAHKVGSFN